MSSDFVPNTPHEHVNVGTYAGIECAEGLIEKQDFWPPHQGLRQRQTLLHATGKCGRIFGFVTRKADGIEKRARFLFRLPAFDAEELAERTTFLELPSDDDIAEHGQMRKDGVALKHDAAVRIGFGLQWRAADFDMTPRRALLAEQHSEKRGLTAARRPDERNERARRNLEIDLLQHDMVAVFFPDFIEDDRVHADRASANHGKALR